MIFFNRRLEKALGKSKFVCDLIGTISRLTNIVDEQKKLNDSLTRTVYLHQEALRELVARQALFMRSMRDSSLDVKLPDGKKTKETKPN